MDTMDTEAAASGAQPGMAGATLRAAREAAGLSVDAVAQQLKLAPRQVTALEEEDFQRLPGRTFVRGFARNYARCVHLDPDAVLALLPAAEHPPALDRSNFAAARHPMGEIPVERVAKASSTRWLLALLLAVGIAAAGYYEYTRQQTAATRDQGPVAAPATVAGTTASPTAGAAASPSSADSSTLTSTALPNPMAETVSAASRVDAADGAAAAARAATPVPEAGVAAAQATANDAALVLAFKGTSWAEVKDSHGRVILQMTGGAGMTQTVSGTAPLELALGNAPEVAVTFRGQALDLAPYTRGNVARVALK